MLAGATVMQAIPAMRDDWMGFAALHVANALLRAGARALVAGGGGGLVGELQALGGEWTEFDFTARTPLRRRRATRGLRDLVAGERVDVVHAYGTDAARMAAAALKRGGARLITSQFSITAPPAWRIPGRRARARGEVVLAVSQFAAELIAACDGVPRERIKVIPGSIDTSWFDPATVAPQRVAALRRRWRIAAGDRVILMPGRLAPGRGHLTLVDAARILVNGGLRGTVFVIAADGAEEGDFVAEVDRRVAAQGLLSIFRRVGRCDDMPAAYAAADFIALPLERPPLFSTVAAEAQAMARPVLASNIGAMPQLIRIPAQGYEGNRTGWLTPPQDPLALARALAAALALNHDACRSMGLRAREFAQGQFSRTHVTAATLSVYSALLDKSP